MQYLVLTDGAKFSSSVGRVDGIIFGRFYLADLTICRVSVHLHILMFPISTYLLNHCLLPAGRISTFALHVRRHLIVRLCLYHCLWKEVMFSLHQRILQG